jgi:hypothetical protein
MDVPFHADLGLVAQRRRGLFSAAKSDAEPSIPSTICRPRIKRYIDAHNSDCRPLARTTSAKAIFEKLAQIPCTICLSQCTSLHLLSKSVH